MIRTTVRMTIAALALLIASGCGAARNSTLPAEMQQFKTNLGLALRDDLLKSLRHEVLLKQRYTVSEYIRDTPREIYIETDWKSHNPGSFESSLGITYLETRIRIIARPRMRVIGQYNAWLTGECRVRFPESGSLQNWPVDAQLQEYFQKIATDMRLGFGVPF